MVSLSIIIPTHDGEDLARCLKSISPQLSDGDEVIVAVDTHGDRTGSGVPDHVWEAIHTTAGVRAIALDDDRHAWGHPQRNLAMELAAGAYLVHIDDDDELMPGALDAIRAAIQEHPDRPHMFRFLAPFGLTLPVLPAVAEGNVGGTGFVAPNDPNRLGRWSDRYEGDFDYITSTLDRYPPNALVWHDQVIARCAVDAPRVWFNAVTTPAEVEAMRVIRNAGREWMTHDASEISPQQQARWWAERDPERVRAWLAMHGQEALGYGLLTWRGGRWWGSLAVKPEARGKGIGTSIYQFLADVCPDDLWVEIRDDNQASLAAAYKAGLSRVYPAFQTDRDEPYQWLMVAHKKAAVPA
jgi:GNAT superfamily N-acetyltransferase